MKYSIFREIKRRRGVSITVSYLLCGVHIKCAPLYPFTTFCHLSWRRVVGGIGEELRKSVI